MLVDDAHQQVFLSTVEGSIVVTDLDGRVTRTITDLETTGEMTLSPDSSTLYVAGGDRLRFGRISQIDTQTYAVTRVALPGNACPMSVTYTAGKVWYWHKPCGDGDVYGVGALDPNTGTAADVIAAAEPGAIRALPDHPDRLTLVGHSGALSVYDVSAGTSNLVAERSAEAPRDACVDAALFPSGDRVVLACGSLLHHEVFHTADLSPAPSIGSSAEPSAVAVSPDGRYVAAGVRGRHWPNVFITDLDAGNSGEVVREYEFPEFSALHTGKLAYSSTGRVFALESPESGDDILHVLEHTGDSGTAIEVDAPKAVDYAGTVAASGRLNYAPGVESTATLIRRDRSGEHDLGTVPVSADGTFSFTDNPEGTGRAVYVVSHPGDATHSAASEKVAVTARPLPYDVNADGYAETVVGVPGEDLGADSNAGMFHLLYGAAPGADAPREVGYHQDSSGVPGSAESGDWFGYSNTSGDFNGDGYADVAVSAGAENLGSAKDAGQVVIMYGSADGLRSDNAQSLSLDNTFLAGTAYSYFGDALTAGDFNGDGSDDLAIGAAWPDAGYVFVSMGDATGLATALQEFHQDTTGVPGVNGVNDSFGWSLAAGDIDGDNRDDLAVGAAFDWEDRDWSTGSVTVLYSGQYGLTGNGAQRWSKDSSGVPGAPRPFNPDQKDASDGFGHQVQLADFNGDGRADLAAGAPGAPVWVDGIRKADAGTVTVLYASATGKLGSSGAADVSQQTAGMPGTAGQNDLLGSTMAAGDANGDGIAELAVFSPADTYVTVIPGGGSGLAYGDAKGWTQNTAGIPGSSETGDNWGNSLRFSNIAGAGHQSLIVGADGENSGKGAFTVIHGSDAGLTATGSRSFSQDSTGISGTAETNDGFGVFY
ncbi:MAG: hypothetical protein ACRDTQ_12760 [Micromonosporaceae bacterium]